MMRCMSTKAFSKLIFIGILLGIFLNVLLIYMKNRSNKRIHDGAQKSSSPFKGPSWHQGSTKWIVVVSSALPTEDTTLLALIPGWNVIEVALTEETKPKIQGDNYCFLGVEQQTQLGFSSGQYLVEGHLARKNIGYLYAISQGATIIYETNDNVRLEAGLNIFKMEPKMRGLMFAGENLFNPYRHFGQPTLWPRGFPLTGIGEKINNQYLLGEWKTPLIQQGLVKNDPDVDALLKLSRKETNAHFNINFDTRSPPVIVPEGVFSSLSASNTLFHYEALWGLMLPSSVSFSECDVWRGYWAQRLLWEIGGTIGYFAPNAALTYSNHSYINKALDERRMYFQTGDLLNSLRKWQCAADLSFFDCVENLSSRMVHWEFWDYSDYELTKAWLADLKKVGFVEPKRLGTFADVVHVRSLFHKVNVSKASSFQDPRAPKVVYYWPAEQNPPAVYSGDVDMHSLSWKHIHRVTKMCAGSKVSVSHEMFQTHKLYDDIVLIVVFNYPHVANIGYLLTLYKMHFQHILFCANDTEKFLEATKHMSQRVSFIKTYVQSGMIVYNCLSHAIAMNYNVSGYLMMGDDVLLNTWNFADLPRDRLWFHKSFAYFNKLHSYEENPWIWWSLRSGKQAYNELSNTLSKLSAKVPIVRDFIDTLEINTKSSNGLLRAVSDFVYVPRRLQNRWLYFAELFARHNVFLELAIPSILGGLDRLKNIVPINAVILWNKNRLNYTSRFNPDSYYMHPFKLGKELKTKQGLGFVCSRIIPLMLNGKPSKH